MLNFNENQFFAENLKLAPHRSFRRIRILSLIFLRFFPHKIMILTKSLNMGKILSYIINSYKKEFT